MKRILFLIVAALLPVAAAGAASEGSYISQTFIDTTIQQAFYYFSAAGPAAGAPMTQEQAIVNAQNVAARLLKLAAGDPNEKYIRWKVGELQAQTFLEQNEVRLRQEYATVTEVNPLIERFNTETGKPRPDFGNLFALQAAVAGLLPEKGNRLADLAERRAENIGKEALFLARKNLADGVYAKAKEECSYLRSNSRYLGIALSDVDEIESGIAVRVRAADLRGTLVDALDRAASAISFRDLAGIRTALDLVDELMRAGGLTTADASGFRYRAEGFRKRSGALEDSLANTAIAVLNARGSDSAIAYVEKVLKPMKLSASRLALIDQRILASSSGPMKPDATDQAVAGDLAALSNDGDAASLYASTFSDIRARADAKARLKVQKSEGEEKIVRPIGGTVRK